MKRSDTSKLNPDSVLRKDLSMKISTKIRGLKSTFKAALLAGLLLAMPGATSLWADTEGEKEKKKKEWKKLEKKQKGKLRQTKNPLKKILKLLKDVEDRLIDADTGEWTRDEQRQVVEALKLQKDAQKALDDLIKKIENQQNKNNNSSSSSSKSNSKKNSSKNSGKSGGKGQQSRKNETPQQRKERLRKERERMKRQKQQQEQKKLEKQLNHKKQGAKRKKQPKGGKKTDNNKKERRSQQTRDSKGQLKPKDGKAQPWGNLPQKLHGDVEKARKEDVPERYRDLINGYRKRINDD